MLKEFYTVTTVVNGQSYKRVIEPRMSLCDFLRDELDLTGTHVGCEHGVCGACTILVDGLPVRSCLMLAPHADGADIQTIEGLANEDGELNVLQWAFREKHALQCGFCTPGFLTTITAFLAENPNPDREEVREALSGNTCRCTGYQHIIDAVLLAAETMRADK